MRICDDRRGFRCPHCGGGKAWPVRSLLLECAACRTEYFSKLTG
ncbi:MAG: transposase [Acidobacteriota bacterium]